MTGAAVPKTLLRAAPAVSRTAAAQPLASGWQRVLALGERSLPLTPGGLAELRAVGGPVAGAPAGTRRGAARARCRIGDAVACDRLRCRLLPDDAVLNGTPAPDATATVGMRDATRAAPFPVP